MGTAIIFGLVTILSVFGLFRAFKDRAVLPIVFNFGTLAVFGFFTVMTFVKSGFPE